MSTQSEKNNEAFESVLLNRSFFQTKRFWIISFLFIFIVCFYITQVPGYRCPITEETHFIVSPLTKDGTKVDYRRAFVEKYCQQPQNLEDNGFRDLVMQLGPSVFADSVDSNDQTWEEFLTSEKNQGFLERTWYPTCKIFKIDPKEKAPWFDFQTLDKYVSKHESSQNDEKLENYDDDEEAYYDICTSGKPWSVGKYPLADEWLKKYNPLLNQIVEISKKPVFIAYHDVNGSMLSLVMEMLPIYGSFAQSLNLRIGYNLNLAITDSAAAGQAIDQVIDDIAAIARLGRKIEQASLISRLVGFALEGSADSDVKQLIESDKATPEQLARLADELNKLPPLADLKIAIEGECYFQYDCLNDMKTGFLLNNFRVMISATELYSKILSKMNFLSPYLFDSQMVRKEYRHVFFDDFRACYNEPSRSKRKAKMDALTQKIERLDVSNPISMLTIQGRSREWARLIASELIPSVFSAENTYKRTASLSQMASTVIALQRYKQVNGVYPEQLSALIPTFLPALPQDYFLDDGNPLIYRLKSDGTYLLYSVGMNLKDDGGWDNYEGDLILGGTLDQKKP